MFIIFSLSFNLYKEFFVVKLPIIVRRKPVHPTPDIEIGEYHVCKSDIEASCVFNLMRRRGQEFRRRTVDGEIRLYRVG